MYNKRLISLTICWILVGVPGLCVLSFADNDSGTNTKDEQHFQKANELHILAEYDAAITEYETVIRLSPDSKIAQNAQYWIGQLYLESGQFDAALSAFQKLLDEYPTSTIIPSTRLMIERVQQAKENRSLFEAAENGDIDQVKQLVAEGADVNAKWADINTKEEEENSPSWHAENTPLYYAVCSGKMEVVKLLVEAGADVNAGSWLPLYRAVDDDKTAIAEYLIAHGAKIDDGADWTALQEAPYASSVEMVELLIAKGADINAGEGKWTTLQAAIHEGRKDIVKLLIQKGANTNVKFREGETILHIASACCIKYINSSKYNPEIVELLIDQGVDVNTKDNIGRTPLHFVCRFNNPKLKKVAELLIAKGADVGSKDKDGRTPLHLAVGFKQEDMAALLIAKGADVSLKDNAGRTALHVAAEKGYKDAVELLIANGVNVNEKNEKNGFTALHYAAKNGQEKVTELLIAKEANIDAKDAKGQTPLYLAAPLDCKVAELLINKGADGSIETESGQTLLQLAQERKQMESIVQDMIFDGNPTNLGPTVNSSANEFDPSISADELELYFNSYRPGGLGKADIWVTTRKTKGDPWSTPVNLGTTVNSSAPDNTPSISVDGLSLYFSSGRSGVGGRDLWVTMRKTKSDLWGNPVNLGPTVNSPEDEIGPSISTDGLALYFSGYTGESERPGGFGKADIWVTTRKTKADPWSTPVNLGPTVNSSTWDGSPSISDDGLLLYFDSLRPGGHGTIDNNSSLDVWVTMRKTKSDPWSNPVNLDSPVNSPYVEANPDISRDGSTLYFVSIRPDGSGEFDLWQVSLREHGAKE